MDRNEKRDVYHRLAKKHGYRARSVYKLMHVDEVYDIFRGVNSVVDLCAAPGSWSQYAAEKLMQTGRPKIVSVDVQDIAPIEGVLCVKDDITSGSCVERIRSELGKEGADLVMCDGAPDITGIHEIDEYLQTELLKAALTTSLQIGREGSSFVGKCLRGEYTPYIASHFEKFYSKVVLLKPKASRPASMECFLYCIGMKVSASPPGEIDVSVEKSMPSLITCGYGSDQDVECKINYD